jgi:hypothetical protein
MCHIDLQSYIIIHTQQDATHSNKLLACQEGFCFIGISSEAIVFSSRVILVLRPLLFLKLVHVAYRKWLSGIKRYPVVCFIT